MTPLSYNKKRLLVRIPWSGVDKTLKPVCLDIAQIRLFPSSLNEPPTFWPSIPQQIIPPSNPISNLVTAFSQTRP